MLRAQRDKRKSDASKEEDRPTPDVACGTSVSDLVHIRARMMRLPEPASFTQSEAALGRWLDVVGGASFCSYEI